jgi:hypothetical protein
MDSSATYSKALKLSAMLAGAIVVVGGGLGYLLAGLPGLISALIGAGVSLVFAAMTILSIWIGSRLPLGGFYGLVLGGWLIKVLLFAIALGVLRGAEFISGPVFFFAVVASVLGGLAIDSWVVLKGRMAITEK